MPATTHVITHVFEMAVPFRVCAKPLSHEEVRRILEDPPESGIYNLPPVKPKGGEIFLFKPVEASQKGANYSYPALI